MPVGLQPGEAGVAAALTVRPDLFRASAHTATLGEVQLEAEPLSLLSGSATRGEILARVIARAWQGKNTERPWILSDQNGEEFRAMEWGHALVRLRGQNAAFSAPNVWYAASSFGDTAAASTLVSVCMAVRSWERHYAPAAGALITATSDGINRGALMLTGDASARRV
jgi:3-oxoacyl-[acyl-carrier-protein] synthase-1